MRNRILLTPSVIVVFGLIATGVVFADDCWIVAARNDATGKITIGAGHTLSDAENVALQDKKPGTHIYQRRHGGCVAVVGRHVTFGDTREQAESLAHNQLSNSGESLEAIEAMSVCCEGGLMIHKRAKSSWDILNDMRKMMGIK